jgi:peptide chain release factor 2
MNKDHILELIKEQKNKINHLEKRWLFLLYDEKLIELRHISSDQLFWQHPNQINILKEEKFLQNIKQSIDNITQNCTDFEELLKQDDLDEEFFEEIKKNCYQQKKELHNLNILLLLNKEDDKKNCFLDINAGAGGTEAQDWAEMLLRMYVRFCEINNLKYALIDQLSGEEAGIKSATLFINAPYATGLLMSENGIHRLVRISPFDANKKRHTSFAAVGITPEIEDIQIKINPLDLRIDTFRAGGAGGQHVNKTDSAVRITHIPTNIVVQCQNERSQLQNKEQAMKMLKSKLHKKEQEERLDNFNAVERKKIEWGSQIRSYVLHPYKMVKDHQTDLESMQPEKVLDGELMEFIEGYLLKRT